MKKTLNVFLLLLLANVALAQTPQSIPYQAVARNSSGTILASTAIGLRFTIHDATATGTVVYQETFNPTTTALGLFSVNVGSGAVVSGTFSAIAWGSNPKYMQVEMDPTGGTSYVDMGTQQMMSVPYALYSNNGVPAGATGDILYNNGGGWVQLSIGAAGQTLNVSGGVPAWLNTFPLLATESVTGVTGTTAASGGVALSNSSVTVTATGVCWGTGTSPTTSGSHTTDGTATGSFTSNITGLAMGTTYHLRAYAVSSAGTTYGNEIVFTTLVPAPTVGTFYLGGIIAYILQPGDAGYDPATFHGLIAAVSDQSTGIAWWNGLYITTGAIGTDIGTGLSNTNAIITSQGPFTSYAASIARSYNGGGYTDWYLPSRDELNKLYINSALIGGFAAGYINYWSSSEIGSNTAWNQNFTNGSENGYYGKDDATEHVRAVRSF